MVSGIVPERADEAFAAFLQQQRPRALAFLQRLCGADAEDVLQDTMAKVWRLRGSFDTQKNGEAWLLQAAFRTFCDQRARCRGPGGEMAADAAAPARPCPVELRDEVQQRLAGLPAIERTLLLGFHRDGLSLKELAVQHAMPLNTVKSHLRRARARLQEES
jgi:RNA polymerase sigma-70 factor (ECF subfamily)